MGVKKFAGGGNCGKMIEYLCSHVKSIEFKQVKLEVRLDNHSAIRAYSKLGFYFSEKNKESGYMLKEL